jgi:hypothetical protein
VKDAITSDLVLAMVPRNSPLSPPELCNHSIATVNRTWNGSIEAQAVFSPVIVACNGSVGSASVFTQYRNPSGRGDYRERWVWEFLRGLAYCYAGMSFCWYLNLRLHPEFLIEIHHYMMILPLTKAGVLFLESEVYRKERVDHVDVIWSLIASVIVHTALCILLICAACGWCTYTERVQTWKILSSAGLSAAFFGSSAVGAFYNPDIFGTIALWRGRLWSVGPDHNQDHPSLRNMNL